MLFRSHESFCKCTALTSVSMTNATVYVGTYDFYECPALKSFSCYALDCVCEYAFYGCAELSSFEISYWSGIPIKEYAFYGCSKITSLEKLIPRNIGKAAFDGCSALTTLNLRSTYTIDDYAFFGSGLSGEIVLSDTLKNIGIYAFAYTNITSITIPDLITEIEEHTFYSCKKLTTFTIPTNVVYIGQECFYECSNLATIYFADKNSTWLGTIDYLSHLGEVRHSLDDVSNATANSEALVVNYYDYPYTKRDN